MIGAPQRSVPTISRVVNDVDQIPLGPCHARATHSPLNALTFVSAEGRETMEEFECATITCDGDGALCEGEGIYLVGELHMCDYCRHLYAFSQIDGSY